MKKAISLILILLATVLATRLPAQDPQQKLYRIRVKDFSLIRNIESKGVTVCNSKPGSYIDVAASPEKIRNLEIDGAEIEYLADNFRDLYPASPDLKSVPGFHNYQATVNELVSIAAAHPDITRLDTIGFSVQGRALLCLKISDNPMLDEDEFPILFLGNHHGNEIHSIEATLYQINYLVNNYGINPEVTGWINNYEIWYVPLVNPDGREAMQRGNFHGVDLNRNYSFAWTAEDNHGTGPFSEPETQAIRDLTAKYPPVMSLSYHTSGQYVLYPWTFTDAAAPDSAAMEYLGNIVSESITYLNSGRVEHYELRQGGRWYFTAGEYCDYMYVNHNCLAYTIEMGISQAPDYTVVPDMVARNLEGMKTILRQARKAGVTGTITDAYSGKPVVAQIDIPAIYNQGLVPARFSDTLYGRYYRYLEPGNYSFQISADGYRTILRDVTISADSLTNWNIRLERAAVLKVDKVTLSDGKSGRTSGNGDGLINPGEMAGLSFTLSNFQTIPSIGAYALVSCTSPFVKLLSDSLFFGNIDGNKTKSSADTALFRLDPGCPDGTNLQFTVSIGDSGGFGWLENIHLDVHAPKTEITRVAIDDSKGNGNAVFDNGETVTIGLNITNKGRQVINDPAVVISTGDPDFQITAAEDNAALLAIGETQTFHFTVALASDAPLALIADFKADISGSEGYTSTMPFKVNNINGFYDDFENGVNGWGHDTYRTTSNLHDDWQLGTPAGKGGDPDHAFSGLNCWGTDMGWDDYAGTSWDGTYQANVYNYLRSPVINCTGLTHVGLKFMRWLTIRPGDYARIKVSGQLVWESPALGRIDKDWNSQIIDISAIADNKPSVSVTFELESNSTGTAGGWNIDDVIVAGGLATIAGLPDIAVQPGSAVLYDAWPNPASSLATVRYFIPDDGPVELTVFNQAGIKVKTLVSSGQLAGLHEVLWDGKNSSGQGLPSGVYLYRLRTGKDSLTKRLIFSR